MPLSISEVVSKFPAEVRDRYDFSEAVYTGALEPITGIICREHGPFKQYSAQLRKNGAGCPACGGEVRASKGRLTHGEAIAKAEALHAGFYSYENARYFRGVDKITVTCPHHGDFQIVANAHIHAGKGCPRCGAIKRGHRKDVATSGRKTADAKLAKHAAAFEEHARAVHGDLYDYSQVQYGGRKVPVAILCPKHGPFEQTPDKHIQRAQGCPECSHHRSKGEAAIVQFLSIFTDVKVRDRKLIAPYELDIYLPEHALAVEYCGEYWHAASSAEEERKTKNRHLDKMRACEAQGIRLITVYESEWLRRPDVIKRLLRNIIGKGRGRIGANKCEVRPVGPVAGEFFDQYHPQGGAGYGQNYGLFYRGRMVSCMRFTFGSNDRGAHADPVWTLSRYASRITVMGGASKLLAHFIRETDPDVIKSFSDNRYFTGAMYEKLGFALEEESAPDYQVYHPKTGLLPKAHWQRRKIPARIRDLRSAETFDPATDHRSEAAMTYLLGAQRMYDCGKKRWIWRKSEGAKTHD